MRKIFDKEFFLSENYPDLIQDYIKNIDVHDKFELKKLFLFILKIDDVYIKLYMLMQIVPRENFIDDEIISLLSLLIKEYREKLKFHILNVETVIDCLIKFLDSERITLSPVSKCLSQIALNDKQIEFIRSIFGFRQIFSYFKFVLENLFIEDYSSEEINMLIRLIDNEELVYGHLYNIFKRTTKYVTKKFIDSNLVQCIDVIKAVILFYPNILKDKDDYYISLASFIVDILKNPLNYNTLRIKNSIRLIAALRIIANHKKTEKMQKVSMGVFTQIFEHMKQFSLTQTSVYEEFLSVTFLIEVLEIYYDIAIKHGSRMFDHEEIFNFVLKISFKKPSAIDDDQCFLLYSTLLNNKYSFLEKIYSQAKIKSFQIECFLKDCENPRLSFYALKNIRKMQKCIIWDDLINLASEKKQIENFVNFIIEDHFLKKEEHRPHLCVYLDKIIEFKRFNLIAFFISEIFKKFIYFNDIYFFQEKLVDLYLANFKNTDFYMKKLQKKILSFFVDQYAKINLDELLRYFLKRLNDLELNVFDSGRLGFLIIMAKINRSLDQCIVSEIFEHFIIDLSHRYNEVQVFDRQTKTVIITLTDFLVDQENTFQIDMFISEKSENKFIRIVIILLYSSQSDFSSDYYESIKKIIFEYLFVCNEYQRHYIGFLVGKIEKKEYFTDFTDDIYDLYDLIRANDRNALEQY